MARGMNAAVLVLIAALVISALGAVGFYGVVGVSISAGSQDEVKQVEGEIASDQEVQPQGSDNPIGYTNSAIRGVMVLWVILTNTSVIIQAVWPWFPDAFADGVQYIFQLAMGFFAIQLIRGVFME